jgi:hypothetical protein
MCCRELLHLQQYFLVPIVYLLSSSPVVCEAQVVAAGSVQFDDRTLLNMKMKNKS